jgi:hypothetical protein
MRANTTSPIAPKTVIPSVRHRQQMIWQVWVPLAASLILALALVILTVLGAAAGSAQVERWANISAVIVIIPQLIIGVVIFAVVGVSAFAIYWLLKRMPGWLLQAQLFMLQVALTTRRVADAATKPVFGANTFSARTRALWRKLTRRKTVNGSLN